MEVVIMMHKDLTLSPLENMSKAEGVLRGVVGMALIEIILLVPFLSETAIAVLATISIYIVLSAVMRWDPFYALTARFGRRHASPLPTAGAPIAERHEETHIETEHKKAA
jgi:hypothetical protein